MPLCDQRSCTRGINFLAISNLIMTDISKRQYRTTQCHEHGQPEISFTVDAIIPDEDCEWLLKSLHDMVAAGNKFADAQTLQMGWGLLKFVSTDDGLCLHEPNMQSMPINFIEGVSSTLRHLRAQKDVLDSLAVQAELDFPNLVSAIIVHKDYQEIADINLLRETAQERLSGWWLFDMTNPEQQHENSDFKPISIYELAINRPDLLQYLALPVGAVVSLSENQAVRVFNGDDELSIRPESYLAALNGMVETEH